MLFLCTSEQVRVYHKSVIHIQIGGAVEEGLLLVVVYVMIPYSEDSNKQHTRKFYGLKHFLAYDTKPPDRLCANRLTPCAEGAVAVIES